MKLYRTKLTFGINAMLLAQITTQLTDANSNVLMRSLEILGPIGGFIVLAVAGFILVYKYVLGPEIKASRASRDEQMRQTVDVAKGFEATSGNLRDTLATAERMQAQVLRVMHIEDTLPTDQARERRTHI